ncbi:MAG TPA: transcriptional repressor [Pirellulaceae bacterium]|nr:transcriptional repressor [Pirellulaceae bacterium]
MSNPTQALTVTSARELLRGASLRCTTCRVAVLQHLSKATGPQSHADVADILVPEGFDKSTIYRCLVEMAEAGIVMRHDLGDHVWRFEFRRGENHESCEHAHFMCTVCGKVECLADVEVVISPTSQSHSNLNSQVTEILLKGHCTACQ